MTTWPLDNYKILCYALNGSKILFGVIRRDVLNLDYDGVPPECISSEREKPTEVQKKWLRRGLGQPGGKLPLFDDQGQKVSEQTVKSCLKKGWVVPWFDNPLKPNWIVCKLTKIGEKVAAAN